jgi:hypothetical protein
MISDIGEFVFEQILLIDNSLLNVKNSNRTNVWDRKPCQNWGEEINVSMHKTKQFLP